MRRGDAKHQGHSEACRHRMEDLIKTKAGGQERIDRALERMTQAIVDHSEVLLKKKEDEKKQEPTASEEQKPPSKAPSTPRSEGFAPSEMEDEQEAPEGTVTYNSDVHTDPSGSDEDMDDDDAAPARAAPEHAPMNESRAGAKRRAEESGDDGARGSADPAPPPVPPSPTSSSAASSSSRGSSDARNFGWTGFSDDMDAGTLQERQKRAKTCLGCRKNIQLEERTAQTFARSSRSPQ